MKQKMISGFVLLGALLLISITVVMAQPSTCEPFIEMALDQLGENCTGLGRNSVCYGFTVVQAALSEEAAEAASFDIPRDVAPIEAVNTLRTMPLDEENDTWGIAVMNTQANLPNTLPGQGVVMLLMGDTSVTNQVTSDAAATPVEPIEAQIISEGSRIRTGAGREFNIIEVLSVGATVMVDGRSDDGEWVRLVHNNTAGWTFYNLVNLSAEELDALPVIEDAIQSPMQAVYFTSGIGVANCEQAPEGLVIQSPKNIKVSITVNEAEIILGSTVVLQLLGNGEMVLYVVEGEAFVNNLVIPAGFKAFVPIELREDIVLALQEQGINLILPEGFGGDGSDGGDGGDGGEEGGDGGDGGTRVESDGGGLPAVTGEWRSCAPITEGDRVWLSTLEDVPASLLNYEIEMPEETDAICASPEELESLRRQQQQQSQIVYGVDCSTFKQTSPLNGMSWQKETFYWDPAGNADSYEVIVRDGNGKTVAAGITSDTNITLDTGIQDDLGGVSYKWSVTAKAANGANACTLELEIPRGAAPPEWLQRNDKDPESEPPPEDPCIECYYYYYEF